MEVGKSKENSGLRKELGDLRRIYSSIYKEKQNTRKGQANEAMSWQGTLLFSSMLNNSLDNKGRMVNGEQPEDV